MLIKIPATLAGLPAITAVIAEGISVNVTLIFSLERYSAVIDAYLDGLEQAKSSGHDISEIHSVASFFVSRVDTEIDKRLKAIGSPEAESLLGEAAIANARLAYQRTSRSSPATAGTRWPRRARPSSARCGPRPASRTPSTTTPVTSSNLSRPERSTRARRRRSTRSPTTASSAATPSPAPTRAASATFSALESLGVDLTDVFEVLETEGVEKFEQSWAELLQTVADALAHGGKPTS